jgi:hypothetical protein
MFNLREPDEDDEERRYQSERQADRISDHTPAPALPPQVRRSPPAPSPITSAMSTLAWTVLHGNWHDARDASKALANIVLEAGETSSPGEGGC